MPQGRRNPFDAFVEDPRVKNAGRLGGDSRDLPAPTRRVQLRAVSSWAAGARLGSSGCSCAAQAGKATYACPNAESLASVSAQDLSFL